jgi:hypothetical protein
MNESRISHLPLEAKLSSVTLFLIPKGNKRYEDIKGYKDVKLLPPDWPSSKYLGNPTLETRG